MIGLYRSANGAITAHLSGQKLMTERLSGTFTERLQKHLCREMSFGMQNHLLTFTGYMQYFLYMIHLAG